MKQSCKIGLLGVFLALPCFGADITSTLPVTISSAGVSAGISNNGLKVDVGTPTVTARQTGAYTVTPGSGTWGVSGSTVIVLQGSLPWQVTGGTFSIVGTTLPVTQSGTWNTNVTTGSLTSFEGGIWTVGLSSGNNTVGVVRGRLQVDTTPSTQTVSYFAADSGQATAATAATDNPILMLVNLSTNTKQVRLQTRSFGCDVVNVIVVYRMFLDSVVTSSGTSKTITKLYSNNAAVSQMQVFGSPTLSSVGSIIDSFAMGQNTSAQYLTEVQPILVDPGHRLVLTANPSSNNRTVWMSIKWVEQ